MMLGMRFLPRQGCCSSPMKSSGKQVVGEMKGASEAAEEASDESNLLKTVGWISAALGAVALGLLVGRELRIRYKFNRRTPYDLYAHSGDELMDVDCGVGI
jgi:hypothetical protein